MPALQRQTSTSVDRYPELVHPLLRWMQGMGDAGSVLSFGCSDGSELTMVALLTKAQILGVDVDQAALEKARLYLGNVPNVRIAASNWEEIRSSGPFDLIFANSVFCRHPEAMTTANLSNRFSFGAFEDALGKLVSNLRPGGVIMVPNCNYSVEDTKLELASLRTPATLFNGFVPKFNRWGEKIIESDGRPVGTSFWAAAGIQDPFQYLRTSVFSKRSDPGGTMEVAGYFSTPAYHLVGGPCLTRSMGGASRPRRLDAAFRPLPYRITYQRVLVRSEPRVLRCVHSTEAWPTGITLLSEAVIDI